MMGVVMTWEASVLKCFVHVFLTSVFPGVWQIGASVDFVFQWAVCAHSRASIDCILVGSVCPQQSIHQLYSSGQCVPTAEHPLTVFQWAVCAHRGTEVMAPGSGLRKIRGLFWRVSVGFPQKACQSEGSKGCGVFWRLSRSQLVEPNK